MYNAQQTTPVLIPVREAFDKIRVGVTTGYALIAQGRLAAVKLGSRTMVTAESLNAFVESLPAFVSKT